MNGRSNFPISRREFARRAAIVSAVSIVHAGTLPLDSSLPASAQPQTQAQSALSPESQAEAEARYQAILASYGSRFSEAQKVELRRLCSAAQPPLDRLREYTIENGDGPALYLKPLVAREKKPEAALPPQGASPSTKKP